MRLANFIVAPILALVCCAATGAAAYDRLPTGQRLDPEGRSIALGSMPLSMVFTPDSTHAAVLLCGYREQGVQIVDLASGHVIQTALQPAAFVGLAFSPDGGSLWTSGGNQDVVYRYTWANGAITLADSVRLAPNGESGNGVRYPSGLAFSPDGRRLYVAENLADSLAVIDVASARVLERVPTGTYPYAVVVGPDGRVYVSAWGGDAVATFSPTADGLVPRERIVTGRHPSALVLARGGERLFVARASFDRVGVFDTRTGRSLGELKVTPAGAPPEGATPNGLALSGDESALYVAEADHNAVAVFRLDRKGTGVLAGRVPTGWYPTAVLAGGGHLHVLNGKGDGTGPNPRAHQPGTKTKRDIRSYTLGQTSGTLTSLPVPSAARLKEFSRRVALADGWTASRPAAAFPPFKHVIYVIKENRTYDQMFGDLAYADGDTSLAYFPRAVSPNHHALAERFGTFDRFFVNGEVGGQGHNWSTAAYSSDYLEKTIPSMYSGRGRSFDYEGANRDTIPADDVNEPGTGYLWDAARRAGVSLRNYGEFVRQDSSGHWIANKASLAPYTCARAPGWDLDITDQARADAWLEEFRAFEAADSLPRLTILRLPNDHTAGSQPGAATPRAYVADNDLALGRVIEALSHSRFWKDTIVFVLEDDAQDGPDHVDSHRSPLLVVSAWNRPGVIHRFANQTDVIATIGRILGLSPLSQFDHFGRPLAGLFAPAPDVRPYRALQPEVPLDQKNPAAAGALGMMDRLDLSREDPADQDLFNRILWIAIKGPDRPYPGTHSLYGHADGD